MNTPCLIGDSNCVVVTAVVRIPADHAVDGALLNCSLPNLNELGHASREVWVIEAVGVF